MANYCGVTRTNYFRVTNPERLKEIIERAIVTEEAMQLWSIERNGETLHAFGGNGSIIGLCKHSDNNECIDSEHWFDDCVVDENMFYDALREIVDPSDAIIITEIGNEKLRFFTAYSMIITKKEISFVDLEGDSVKEACRLLDNSNWSTRMDF